MKGFDEDEPVNRHLGEFRISAEQNLVGELTLAGPETLLRVHSASKIDGVGQRTDLTGMSYSGDFLTLIGCINQGGGSTWNGKDVRRYRANIFPHFVVVGRKHLDPTAKSIRALHFTVPDAASLFYDWDAFGQMTNARPVIEQVLEELREFRPIQAGESPAVAYFTGQLGIAEVNTRVGKISVNHRPTTNSGGPDGVYIKNKIMISIEPESPVDFQAAIDASLELYTFLSMAAGRRQQIKEIHLEIPEEGEDFPQSAIVYPSYFLGREDTEAADPHPSDFPLDPIRKREEFETVIAEWMERNKSWGDARGRYLGCIKKGTVYDPDRLVAAANMFDLLPSGSVPKAAAIPQALGAARDACKEILLRIDPSPARDGVLGALGRLGQPAIRGKIEYRASLITSKLPGALKDLDHVIAIAVKRRNFYVHGSSGGLNMEAVGPFVPFLTDTLEFIFIASDLVEAGWDIARWRVGHAGWGHSLSRYLNDYDSALVQLLRDVPRVPAST